MRGRGRTFIPTDNVGEPCNCLECQAAGVTHLPTRYVPPDEYSSKARWLHGEELKAWHAAHEKAKDDARRLFEEKGLDPKKMRDAMGGSR